MALIVMIRVMRGFHFRSQGVRFVSLLALWASLAWRVPAAMPAIAPSSDLWSIQLHGGRFAPIEASGTSPMVGMRYCKHYNSYLQGGLLSGWTSISKRVEQPANDSPNFTPQAEVARLDAHLVPLMGYIQVNLTGGRRLVPYLGIGAGYEWLMLDAQDHRTGLESHASYGNMAWETFGGVGLRMSGWVRLNGELFYNGGSLKRTIFDASGHSWLEVIPVNGVGARVGLDMGFE